MQFTKTLLALAAVFGAVFQLQGCGAATTEAPGNTSNSTRMLEDAARRLDCCTGGGLLTVSESLSVWAQDLCSRAARSAAVPSKMRRSTPGASAESGLAKTVRLSKGPSTE